MIEISTNIPFFEYFENHFEWHKKSCFITKLNWTKENKKVVRSSNPPQENITIKHQGFDLVATPFRKPSSEDKPKKKKNHRTKQLHQPMFRCHRKIARQD